MICLIYTYIHEAPLQDASHTQEHNLSHWTKYDVILILWFWLVLHMISTWRAILYGVIFLMWVVLF